jgi:hypothetical protein
MFTHTSEIEHTLGREEVVSGITALCRHFGAYSDMEGTWEGNVFTFTVSVQGVPLRSTVHVEEGRLKVECEAPLYGSMFADRPSLMMRAALQPRANKVAPAEPPPEAGSSPTVVFLHLPKAGGLSLSEYIAHQCSYGEQVEAAGLLRGGILYLQHGFFKAADLAPPSYIRPFLRRPDLRAVVGHLTFGLHEHLTHPWTYVTLLRDPVERIVSMYYFLGLQEQMSLEQFAADPPFREIDNDQTRRIAGVDPALGALTREALETAKENLRRHFSVVGTSERFDETLVLLHRRLGWTREVPARRLNATPEREPVSSLPSSSVEAIRGWNELDCELHRFADEWMDQAIAEEGPAFQDDLARRRGLQAVPQG